jgi:hypothetical protein
MIAPTTTGEGTYYKKEYEQSGQQTPPDPDEQQRSSRGHLDPDGRDHLDPRQTQDSDDGECPKSETEPKEGATTKNDPNVPGSRQQSDEPKHKSDAKEENTPQKYRSARLTEKARVRTQKLPEESRTIVPKASIEKQKKKTERETVSVEYYYAYIDKDTEVKRLQKVISDLQHNFAQLESSNQELFREKTQLKQRLETLQTSHIQSINSVNTGLEPISDETFEKGFRALHDDVCYCIPVIANSDDGLRSASGAENFSNTKT